MKIRKSKVILPFIATIATTSILAVAISCNNNGRSDSEEVRKARLETVNQSLELATIVVNSVSDLKLANNVDALRLRNQLLTLPASTRMFLALFDEESKTKLEPAFKNVTFNGIESANQVEILKEDNSSIKFTFSLKGQYLGESATTSASLTLDNLTPYTSNETIKNKQLLEISQGFTNLEFSAKNRIATVEFIKEVNSVLIINKVVFSEFLDTQDKQRFLDNIGDAKISLINSMTVNKQNSSLLDVSLIIDLQGASHSQEINFKISNLITEEEFLKNQAINVLTKIEENLNQHDYVVNDSQLTREAFKTALEKQFSKQILESYLETTSIKNLNTNLSNAVIGSLVSATLSTTDNKVVTLKFNLTTTYESKDYTKEILVNISGFK
ncbi:hypothetical protein ACA758_02925 [Mycoplasmopsis agassizii]|uniref:hypothetical protein n=1 Tax=Mycoplasmopsis agassizii TaxID=33922 RepID=UPI0035291290